MFVSCIASSSNQVDSITSDLKKKDVVLQDPSLSDLLKQISEMQQQQKNLMSSSTYQLNQKKIADIEKMINLSVQKINQLLIWKNEIDNKVNHPKSVINMTLLNQRLQPMNSEIEKLKDTLEKVSQRENAVQMAVEKQITQMGYLFQEVNVIKSKLLSTKKGIQYLMWNIQVSSDQFQRTMKNLRKQDKDLKMLSKRMDENTVTLSNQIKELKNQTMSFRTFLQKIQRNIPIIIEKILKTKKKL